MSQRSLLLFPLLMVVSGGWVGKIVTAFVPSGAVSLKLVARTTSYDVHHKNLHHVLPPAQQRLPLVVVWSQPSENNDSDQTSSAMTTSLKRVPSELEGVPIPFVDPAASGSNALPFIECYADSICVIDNVEYTIAVPCDYSVALCYTEDGTKDQLIPVELSDTETMDDLFPVAEAIVADEFGEELVLQRTPQTLTLVGELDDENEEEDDDDDDEEADEDEEEEEEVEVLLSFEHRDKEYLLVRIMDPILLVGKKPEKESDEVTMDMRVLLTPEQSDAVMPILEDMFLKFHNDQYEEEDEEDSDNNVQP